MRVWFSDACSERVEHGFSLGRSKNTTYDNRDQSFINSQYDMCSIIVWIVYCRLITTAAPGAAGAAGGAAAAAGGGGGGGGGACSTE